MAKAVQSSRKKASSKKQAVKSGGIRGWLSVGKRATLVPLAIFALLFSAVGAYYVTQSKAAVSGPLGAYDCRILGRIWNGSKCTNECESKVNGNRLITSRAYNYCSGNISFISQSVCNQKKRVWSVYVDGCARRNDQQTTTQRNPGPKQCQYGYARYVVQSDIDKCDTPYTPSPTSK